MRLVTFHDGKPVLTELVHSTAQAERKAREYGRNKPRGVNFLSVHLYTEQAYGGRWCRGSGWRATPIEDDLRNAPGQPKVLAV